MTTDARDAEAGAPMSAGIRIGRILGVPVYLKPSWFLVAVVITFVFAPNVPAAITSTFEVYAISFGFAVVLLLSVLVHELAHAVAARATGTPATHIVLDLWGGHTAFETEAALPGRSVVTAAVGPLSNLALAAAVLVVLRSSDHGDVAGTLLAATAWSNIVVAAFNALPGLPLDGGRVLEAAVWKLTGDRLRGTVVAGWFGRLMALLLAGVTVVAMINGTSPASGIWLLLIAAMLWQGAGQSLAAVSWLRRAAVVDPRALMRPAVAVPTSSSVESVLLAAAHGQVQTVVLLDVYGRPTAVVDERSAGQVAPASAGQVPASSVAEVLVEGAIVDVRFGGEDLISALQRVPAPRYAVVDGAERVVGVLEWDDVARFVSRR